MAAWELPQGNTLFCVLVQRTLKAMKYNSPALANNYDYISYALTFLATIATKRKERNGRTV